MLEYYDMGRVSVCVYLCFLFLLPNQLVYQQFPSPHEQKMVSVDLSSINAFTVFATICVTASLNFKFSVEKEKDHVLV